MIENGTTATATTEDYEIKKTLGDVLKIINSTMTDDDHDGEYVHLSSLFALPLRLEPVKVLAGVLLPVVESCERGVSVGGAGHAEWEHAAT